MYINEGGGNILMIPLSKTNMSNFRMIYQGIYAFRPYYAV